MKHETENGEQGVIIYRMDDFVDITYGPLIPYTTHIDKFALTKVFIHFFVPNHTVSCFIFRLIPVEVNRRCDGDFESYVGDGIRWVLFTFTANNFQVECRDSEYRFIGVSVPKDLKCSSYSWDLICNASVMSNINQRELVETSS